MASTRRSTLCRSSDSVLARMFDHSNERRAPPFVRDSKGRYFVQYNDYCFRKIIEVLRMKRWPWPPTASALNLPSGSGESGFSEGPNRFRIHVREDEREDFNSLVSYFFPGCEKFINEVVGRVRDCRDCSETRILLPKVRILPIPKDLAAKIPRTASNCFLFMDG